MRIEIAFALSCLISIAFAQQALDYTSTGNIVKTSTDLKQVFGNDYLATQNLGTLSYEFSLFSSITINNVVCSQKSFDSTLESVKFNATTKTLSYRNGSDEFSFTFDYIYTGTFISTRKGKGVGTVKLSNLGFDKVIADNKGKVTFTLQNPTLTLSQLFASSINPAHSDILGYINKNVLTDSNRDHVAQVFTDAFKTNAQKLFTNQQPSASNKLVISQVKGGKTENITFNSTLTKYTLTSKEEIKFYDFSVFGFPGQKETNVSATINASFGNSQTIYSKSVLQNTIDYASVNGYFSTILNESVWNISSFQFFVGDLSYIMPSVSNDYYADTKLTGSCGASNLTDLKVCICF